MNQVLRSSIPFPKCVTVDVTATFLYNHGINQGNHSFFVAEIQLRINGDAGELGNIVNVALGVILCRRSPCGNDCGESGTLVVLDITTHEDEASTHAVEHADELFEVGVIGLPDFAKPYVANTYVKWVVVADAARNIWFHFVLNSIISIKK